MFEWTDHVLAAERRRAERTALDLPLRLRDRDGATFDARLCNLSREGLMAQSDVALLERAPVRVLLPMLEWVRGEVAWAMGTRCGIRFRLPLTLTTYEQLLALAQPDLSSATPASRSNR